MKKRFISLVAAAALVGSVAVVSTPATSQAGTVSVKGDTQVQMYGFVLANFSWDKQMAGKGNPDFSNMPKRDSVNDDTQLYKDTYNKTNFSTNTYRARIGFSFKNREAGIKGKIEGDFNHDSNFRLRKAYIRHNFDNFYLLIGQEYVLEDISSESISAGDASPAGFNEGVSRVPQVRIGTNLDLGGASLDLAFAFESGSKKAVKSSSEANALEVNRVVMPYTAARAILHFDTSFGAPVQAYVWGSVIPVKLSDKTKDDESIATKTGDYNVSDKSKTSYAFGVGAKVPVSMVTIGANYQYSKGATNYAGLSDYQPASYYSNGKDDVEDTKMQAFNANVVVSPMPSLSVGAEYDYVEFKNDDVFTGNDKPKVTTYLGNVKIKTTKYTTLSLEWRHVKAEKFDSIPNGPKDDKFSGDQFYALYKYTF